MCGFLYLNHQELTLRCPIQHGDKANHQNKTHQDCREQFRSTITKTKDITILIDSYVNG